MRTHTREIGYSNYDIMMIYEKLKFFNKENKIVKLLSIFMKKYTVFILLYIVNNI